ncbi:MAG: hypothetical protein ABGX26_04345 [Nautiliaceae bacterium]|jgi:hypothetical protein
MLKKLSLAALIAMGSMSVASATSLSDAIKNVDLSGKIRVRLYHEMPKDQNSYNRWRTNAVFVFKNPIGDTGFSIVMRNSVESNVYTDDDSLTDTQAGGTTSVDSNILNNLLFIQYKKDNVSAILGKIPVATSITSADYFAPGHGAGAIATYTVNKNLTVAAAWIDALKNGKTVVANTADVYAIAALFNTDMVKGNAWYYQITNTVKHLVTLSLDATPVKDVDVHVDFANGKNEGSNVKSTTYYNISAKYAQDAFCVKAGYAYVNDGNSLVTTSIDAPIAKVIPTVNNYSIADKSDRTALYAKVGYNVDNATSVYVAYQHQNDKTSANNDLNEYTLGAKYAVNKKLSFAAAYDVADFKVNTSDNKEFRFEGNYKF